MPVMQNYSTSYFAFKHTLLDSVFNADYEYFLSFSIWKSLRGEKRKILRGCQQWRN
jgi:hypothetical protein